MTMNREDQLREALRRLQTEYQVRAQPIVDELAKIESMKPARHFIDLQRYLDAAGAEAMQKNKIAIDAVARDAASGLGVMRVGIDGKAEHVSLSEFYAQPEDDTLTGS